MCPYSLCPVGHAAGTLGLSHCCVIGEESENVKGREDAVCCVELMEKEFLLLGIESTVKTSIAGGGSNFILHPSIMVSKTSRYA